jgi:hypothetical protein
METDAVFCGARSLVDMDAGDWFTGCGVFASADCVVEEDDLLGSWDGL